MFVETQQTREQKELNTRERKGQDATKNNVCSRRFMHPISLVSDANLDDSADVDGEQHSQSNTIEDFTEEIDEAGFVGHSLVKRN